MEKIRRSFFSGSWYPDTRNGVEKQLEKWENDLGPAERNAIAGVVPHAGWYFSGKPAYDVIRRFTGRIDILVVLGGHLPEVYPYLHWTCDSCETPKGKLPVHKELRDFLKDSLNSEADDSADNTIEVQLPIIHEVLGEIPIVPFRAPAGEGCLEIVEQLKTFGDERNQVIGVLGSTDLTHYGPNYGFMPDDSLNSPLSWVEASDGKILDAMVEMRSRDVLKLANTYSSACSAGAAAAAAEFGKMKGSEKGELLSYDTSYSKHRADSFVGYGAVTYSS